MRRRPQPNPVGLTKNDPSLRKTNCRHTDHCLGLLFKQPWEGFSCAECDAFEPLRTDDRSGIVKLLEKMASKKG